ncbi:MAG: aldose 1-epimerase family protein [Rhodospirillales bacterium]|nr:aldose 1-epimerase family protein [Rhodospirillales bacterium]
MPVLFGQSFSRRELARRVGDFSQVFGVELLAYEDGPERALRFLRFRTGSGLSFDILVDRAMDLGGMTYRGVPIGWHSPAGFRHPWLHEIDAEDGLGWLRSFSGMMNTCGLDHIMAATEDTAEPYCYPDRKRVFHGLHGRISYQPARLAAYGERWEDERCFLYAEGTIRQAAMYAENLVLERRIEVEVGTDTVHFQDRVRNLGFYATPHVLLYHVNLGWPVVDEHTRLVAPIEATPFTAHDPRASRFGPIEQAEPQPRFHQQVYEHRIAMEADGTAHAALVNNAFETPAGERGIGLEIAWDGKSMPALFQWQNLQEGNYVVAMEPATVHGGSREDWKARGEIQMLNYGDGRDYRLAITPHAGQAAIEALKHRLIQSR